MSKENSGSRLPLSTKLLFGWGDVFGGGGTIINTFFYAIFLTDVAKKPLLRGHRRADQQNLGRGL